jgi:membrane-bound metal-dependent hydrolase YbcI (DUF457 family)
MAQAGIHGMVGMAVRRWTSGREWLALGIVLGNLLPDADNLAVAGATLAGLPTAGLHRTFTHSLFFAGGIALVFAIVARLYKRPRWENLGVGLGIGVVMHILLDLLVWFDGVEILWPIPSWVNLWANVKPPVWWSKLMMPAEFLCFALLFALLDRTARIAHLDRGASCALGGLYRAGLCYGDRIHDPIRRALLGIAGIGRWCGHPHEVYGRGCLRMIRNWARPYLSDLLKARGAGVG